MYALSTDRRAKTRNEQVELPSGDVRAVDGRTEHRADAREHNDAWVVAVGGRMHSLEEMTRLVEVFLATPFPGDDRHVRRIGQMASYETTGELPPLPASAQGEGQPAPGDA